MAPTSSQRYLSTRGGSSGFSFEQVVLKGLAEVGNFPFTFRVVLLRPKAFSSIGRRPIHSRGNSNTTSRLGVEMARLYI